MITKQDSRLLQKDFSKVFATKTEMNARFAALEKKMNIRFEAFEEKMNIRFKALEEKMNARFNKADNNAEEQTISLATTLASIIKRLDSIEGHQIKMEEFMKVMSIKLLNHDGRIVTLESKILLS